MEKIEYISYDAETLKYFTNNNENNNNRELLEESLCGRANPSAIERAYVCLKIRREKLVVYHREKKK